MRADASPVAGGKMSAKATQLLRLREWKIRHLSDFETGLFQGIFNNFSL